MKKNIISAIILTAIISGSAAMAQKKNGWVKLFDGKTTQGWHTYGKATAGTAWKVENGALHFDPKAEKAERGDIVTDKEYGNFHLKLEWKVAPKANSGIMLFVNRGPIKIPSDLQYWIRNAGIG